MIYVAHITSQQAEELKGQTFDGVQYFNPTQDKDGNWCLSQQEIEQCTTVEWVKQLVADKEYKPKTIEI